MEELNTMNLDELLKVGDNAMSGKLFETADLDVTIVKEEAEEEVSSVDVREEAMKKLAEYESYENTLSRLDGEYNLLSQELEGLISKIKQENKELLDRINDIANEIDKTKLAQDKVKEELLPLQRVVYNNDNADKTLKYNKIQSTYVAPSEKNKFDLKKFREERKTFWEENLEVLSPYAEITAVSDYLKVTISKK